MWELTQKRSSLRNAATLEFLLLLLQQTRSLFPLPLLQLRLTIKYMAFGSTADNEYFWRTLNLDPCFILLCREDRKRRLFFPLSNTNQAQERS